ncbi:MAG TPA: thioredoxin domain-containing protein [Polyangiaceae bacterium]|nr:thioredoxin domain-containing protein [Polyangiaceae bacterium]
MVTLYQSGRDNASKKCAEKAIFQPVNAKALRLLGQLCLLVAIAASAALLVDSLGATPAYCTGTSGCHDAKMLARQVLGAVPLPLVGLLALYALLSVSAFGNAGWARRLELLGAAIGAVIAATLLMVQAVILKSFCPFCVIVDGCAVLALAAFWGARTRAPSGSQLNLLHPSALLALGLAAAAIPVLWPYFRAAAPVPPQLSEFQVPDRLTLVEFVDLDCEHCRALYPVLESVQADQATKLHVVRIHVPHRAHARARAAARLLVCASSDQARLEQLNRLFFESPQLDQTTIVGAAEGVGMSEAEVNACLADPASDAAIEANLQRLESLGFEGLPTTYVGGERIVGALPKAFYEATITRVQQSKGRETTSILAFYPVLAALTLGIVWIGRVRHAPRSLT